MANIVIIEDEPLAAQHLITLLGEVMPEAHVAAVLSSVDEAFSWLYSHPSPHLIFADMHLRDGNSFDIFREINGDYPIIFTAALDDYLVRAFKLNGIDYLLKPVEKNALEDAVRKFRESVPGDHHVRNQLLRLIADLNQSRSPKFKERFRAHFMNVVVPVDADTVACFRKDQVIHIITTDNRELVTDYPSMEHIESMVDPERFFRANRQHIIHIAAIRTYKQESNGKITVSLKKPLSFTIDISREKAQAFRKWFSS